MYSAQRVRHLLALPRHHLVEFGLIIALAIVAGGTVAINGGIFTPGSHEVAPKAITGPVANTLPDSAFPSQAQGFLHPLAALPEEPANAALTAQEARAEELQQQAMAMMDQGNYARAQDLSRQRDALLRGEQSASAASPALTEQEAQAQDLQQQAMMMLNEGDYARAQELSRQRDALLRGEQSASAASPALTAQQARAEALRQQGDAYMNTGDYQHAQQLYKQSDAVLRGEAK